MSVHNERIILSGIEGIEFSLFLSCSYGTCRRTAIFENFSQFVDFAQSLKKIARIPPMLVENSFKEVIAQLGAFSPSQHSLRVRESNAALKRIKENVFKKQVQQVWNKHGYWLAIQY